MISKIKKYSSPTIPEAFQVTFVYQLPDGTSERVKRLAMRVDGKPYLTLPEVEKWAKTNDLHIWEQYKNRKEKVKVQAKENEEKTKNILFKEAADKLFAKLEKGVENERRKSSYARTTESLLRVHLIPKFGEMKIRSITTSLIDAYRVELQTAAPKQKRKSKEKISSTTINRILTMLSMVFNLVQRDDPSFIPPHIEREEVDEDNEEIEIFEPDEMKKLLNCQNILQLRALVALGIFGGLRASELAGIKFEDFEKDTFTIKRAIVEGVIGKPKSGKGAKSGERTIPIQKSLAKVLNDLPNKAGYILCDENGDFLSYHQIRDLLKKAEEKAGLPVTGRLHRMRHTFCTALAINNVPPTVVQKLAGHSSLKTTERYFHASDKAKRTAIDTLEMGGIDEKAA